MRSPAQEDGPAGVLTGLKVVEIAQLVAGGMPGSLLADLGADVIHIEDPWAGDPVRRLGPDKDGANLWWKVAGRNKRSVTIDLRREEGQKLARQLAAWADVVISNLALPTLMACGLDPQSLHARYPNLVVLHVSAFGATSSRRDEDGVRPGAGKVAEALSGVPHITGSAGEPPTFSGFAQAETLTALVGAFAIQAALYRRDTDPDFHGECIDLALFEPMFRLVEWQVIVHDQLGTVFERAGNQMVVGSDGVVDTYRTADGDWIIISPGTRRVMSNLCQLLGQDTDQPPDTKLLKRLLGAWVSRWNTDECLHSLAEAGVSGSRIYSVADIVHDAAFLERESVVTVEDDELGPVRMQAALPHLLNHPGAIRRTGPPLGADNEEVFRNVLGLTPREIAGLAQSGVI
jgi:formyl-CoA transferase